MRFSPIAVLVLAAVVALGPQHAIADAPAINGRVDSTVIQEAADSAGMVRPCERLPSVAGSVSCEDLMTALLNSVSCLQQAPASWPECMTPERICIEFRAATTPPLSDPGAWAHRTKDGRGVTWFGGVGHPFRWTAPDVTLPSGGTSVAEGFYTVADEACEQVEV